MGNWIIPCNAKYYDVVGAFDKLKQIDWRQSTKVEIDDTVYIYVSRPYSSIMFKCKAIEVNISNPNIDDAEFMREPFTNYGNYMRLELVEKYPQEQYNLEVLRAHGIKGSIQGPIRVPEGVQDLFEPQRYVTTNPQPKRETPAVPKPRITPNVSTSAPKFHAETHPRTNEYPAGAKVIHKKYGEGVVETNNGRILSIRFADFGLKVFSIEIVLEKHLIELA